MLPSLLLLLWMMVCIYTILSLFRINIKIGLNRRAFSEVLYDAPRTSKLKEDARQVEFVRIGQALKLEAIVRGDAPTSLASTGPGSCFKRSPWEPQCFYASKYSPKSRFKMQKFNECLLF